LSSAAGADAVGAIEQKVAELQAQVGDYRGLSTTLGHDA